MSGERPRSGRTQDSESGAPQRSDSADEATSPFDLTVRANDEALPEVLPEVLLDSSGRRQRKSEKDAAETFFSRDRRARYGGTLPKPPEAGDIEVLYAKLREELKDLDDGQAVRLLVQTHAWESTVGTACDALDAVADCRRAYTARELETALLFQRFNGYRTYTAARKYLAGDESVFARQELGFDRPRDHIKNRFLKYRKNRKMDGVPSAATVCRHRKHRFLEAQRAELYAECFLRIIEEHAAEFPEFRDELLMLGFDGSAQKSVFRPGNKTDKDGNVLFKPDTGEVIPRVEGWEGGSVTRSDMPESKRGHGFMTVTAHTTSVFPVAVRSARLGPDHEIELALDMLREDMPRIRACTDQDKVGVSTLDGVYASPRIRLAHRKVGYIENTHQVSHGTHDSAERHLNKRLAKVFEIDEFPNWRANGLRELYCMCGHGEVFSRPSVNRHGEAVAATEGRCDSCGPIHITSGDWRKVQNPSKYVRVNPRDAVNVDAADWEFGNFLTYRDKRAKAYGTARYAQGEGLHGHATTRFGLFKDRNYYRRINQARLDSLLTYCLMHAVGMECRRRRAATAMSAPPPTPLRRATAPPPEALAA